MKRREEKTVTSYAPSVTAVVVLMPSSMVFRVTMDFFQHRYYRLSKILMMVIGQWPYQSTRSKWSFRAVLFVITTSISIPEILVAIKYRNDWKILLECLPICVFGLICAIKLCNFVWNSQKREKLINIIRTNWHAWARSREVNILHVYAEQGEKITNLYTAMLYSILFIFICQPAIPKIIDNLLRNGSASGEFPYPVVYYYIDEQKYYFYLIVYTYVSASLLLTTLISNDVILIIYVQHVCSIFAALGHKLKRIGNNGTSVQTEECLDALSRRDMEDICSCIDRHNDAIKYANLIDACYTQTFFVTNALGMILINGIALQALMKTNENDSSTRFILVVLTIIFYFYIESYISQILIDHSINIRYDIYNGQWYKLSLKAQKLLQFMTMRCTVPCQLTAGKMMIMSVRTFWLAVKTAISFFGFFRSTQGL